MRFDKQHMLKFLDTAIQKREAQLQAGKGLFRDDMNVELYILKDLRDGIEAGEIPNSTGKMHEQFEKEREYEEYKEKRRARV